MKANSEKQNAGTSSLPDEGSEIIYGHNAKSKEELRQQIEDKNWDVLLTKVPVKAGDFFYVPSGTMHAIGARYF